jgi:hypothetical protein
MVNAVLLAGEAMLEDRARLLSRKSVFDVAELDCRKDLLCIQLGEESP